MTLSLNGQTISNESNVFASDIGEGGNDMTTTGGGLLCITENSDCCRATDNQNGGGQGKWYFSNETAVDIEGGRTGDFFYRNRDAKIVRLNRRGNPTERGRFRCEIPNADGDLVNLSVNVGEYKLWIVIATYTILYSILVDPPPPSEPPMTTTSEATPTITGVSITASGTATAGETFRLICTVTVTGSNDQLMITWLMGPMNNMVNTNADGVTVVTTDSMSTLTFNPLSASHAGTYTCRATLGSAVDSTSRTINVQSE